MKHVDKSKMVHHRARAESFIEAMKLLATELESYLDAVALLAVHGVISLNDAILISCSGRRSNDKEHLAATRPLKEICEVRKIDRGGINHLIWLLQRKNDIAYGDMALAASDARLAVVNAERFQAWAYRNFPELAHEDESTH